MTSESALEVFNQLVGTWTLEATHPAIPGRVHDIANIEWLEGERFLTQRTRIAAVPRRRPLE